MHLNSFLARLLDLAPPEELPPWHRLQLASFLRRSAAAGYLPPEEEAAYFRLASRLLRETEAILRAGGEDSHLLPFILSERGLALAESTLADPAGGGAALAEAARLWGEADSLVPSSSAYARARWAAWSGDPAELGRYLPHSARDEDLMLWPAFPEALLEPAFRSARDDPGFKRLWFGYSR
jgi:hypothetical protein